MSKATLKSFRIILSHREEDGTLSISVNLAELEQLLKKLGVDTNCMSAADVADHLVNPRDEEPDAPTPLEDAVVESVNCAKAWLAKADEREPDREFWR